jgi:hypothetical protein
VNGDAQTQLTWLVVRAEFTVASTAEDDVSAILLQPSPDALNLGAVGLVIAARQNELAPKLEVEHLEQIERVGIEAGFVHAFQESLAASRQIRSADDAPALSGFVSASRNWVIAGNPS